MSRELTDDELNAGFKPLSIPANEPAVYICRRDMLHKKVRCQVQGGDYSLPHVLENVGHHSPDGFEMGYGGSGPADLALTILLHHLRVPVDAAANALRGGFCTPDKKVLQAWMSHQRLKEQRIALDSNYCEVTSLELDRLLETGFLTVELEREWERGAPRREFDQRAATKKKSGAFSKPANEEKEK
jgi:hypothetical protein